MRYVSAGVMNYYGITPGDPGYATAALPLVTMSNNEVPAYSVSNLTGSYDFKLKGSTLQLFAAVDNVFDKNPPIAAGSGFGGNANGGANPVFFDTLWMRVPRRASRDVLTPSYRSFRGRIFSMRPLFIRSRAVTARGAPTRARRPRRARRAFWYTMPGSTRLTPANVPKPQSVPAITRSRPTMFAYLHERCAMSSGCST